MLATLLGFNASAIGTNDYLRLIALLVGAILLYVLYKVFYPRDFGVPVRRRLLRTGMTVERDQVAFVPFWWSDIQIQHAVRSHWKQSLRETFDGRTRKRDA